MEMKNIVIVGSGTGGTFVANLLSTKMKREIQEGLVEIHLFGDREEHVFQPALLDVAFRGTDPNKIQKEEKHLVRNAVKFHDDPVDRINLKERNIALKDDGIFPYDYIVIATGASLHPEAIPGLSENALTFHNTPEEAHKIWQALQTFEGGKIVIAVAGVPHKCPPSPNEATFLIDELLRRRGIREKSEITFVTPYPRIYPAAEVSKVVEPLFEEKGIQVKTFFNVDSVDPAKKQLYSLEGDSLDYDLLIGVPPHRGAEVINKSQLGDAEGWIPTDKYTMHVAGSDDAYAIGDATNIPLSKTGVVAHLEANVVAKNIFADFTGSSSEYKFNGRINCPFETGNGRATFVIATYQSPPKQIQPSRWNYIMKRGFSHIYWTTLSGRWEPIFGRYFKNTAQEGLRTAPAPTPIPN
jgi:sulfide:quinone oxidoreductase